MSTRAQSIESAPQQQPTAPPSAASGSTDPTAPGVNLERKARKEAQKALKAQQAAEKKAAAAASSASASKSQPSSSSKPKPPPRKQSSEEQLSRALSYILRHGAEKEGLEIRPDGYILLSDVLERPRVKSVNMDEAQGGRRRAGLEDVKRVVESNDKKRFELTQREDGQWWVRAVQGHSLKSVVELEHVRLTEKNLGLLKVRQRDEEEEGEAEDQGLEEEMDAKMDGMQIREDGRDVVEVIHGTNASAWEEILASGGLKPMSRNHIHLAKGKFGDKGVISGMRRSASRLIYIDIRRAIKDGVEFHLSSNGVVLTSGDKEKGVLGSEYFTRVEDQKGHIVWSQPPSGRN
ncbi:tRNA 2'-phosphotransferase [Pseudozyma hubeiensis]|nr:tRNA 2'-phosphotransferase [Pseudozyma hubeiensis]